MSFTQSEDTYTPTSGVRWTTNAVHFWMSILRSDVNRQHLCTVTTKDQLYNTFCQWVRTFVTRQGKELSLLEQVWKCGNGCNVCANDVVKSATCDSRFHYKQPMTPQVISFLLKRLPDGDITNPAEDRNRYYASGTATKDESTIAPLESGLRCPDSWKEYNEHMQDCVAYMDTLPAIEWYNAMRAWVTHRIIQCQDPWLNTNNYGDGILFQLLKDFTFERFVEVADKMSAIFKLQSADGNSFGLIWVNRAKVTINKALLSDVKWCRTPMSRTEFRKKQAADERASGELDEMFY